MKKNSFIPLFFVVLLFSQLSEDAVLRLWYQLGNESFTEVFCDNINEPQLECRGSCFIGSQLEQNINEQTLSLDLIKLPSSIEIFVLPEGYRFKIPSFFIKCQQIERYSFSLKEWVFLLKLLPPQF